MASKCVYYFILRVRASHHCWWPMPMPEEEAGKRKSINIFCGKWIKLRFHGGREREREKKTYFHSIKYSGEAEHNITLNRKMEFSLWWRKFTCTKLLQPLRAKRKKRFVCGASVARTGIFFSLLFVRIAIDVYCVYCVGSTSVRSQFYFELGLGPELSRHMHTAHSDTIHIFFTIHLITSGRRRRHSRWRRIKSWEKITSQQ